MAQILLKILIMVMISATSASAAIYELLPDDVFPDQETCEVLQYYPPVHCKVIDDHFSVLQDGKYDEILIKGVNMGMAKPGHFPGEGAITYNEYYRWITQIHEMNANAIRTYTTHPPQFYDALYDFNQVSEDPIYLFQGIWVDEVLMDQANDIFDERLTDDLTFSIEETCDVIHGNVETIYGSDISSYVLGIILGVEWAPELVKVTNEKNQDRSDLEGEYIQTSNASPFEIWLASMMEHTATYEQDNYAHQIPLSFINFQLLDKIEHRNEPAGYNDMASIDPDTITATSKFTSSIFATFHVYPYYPDFMNLERELAGYLDASGECNNFAGYLNQLKREHTTPIFIGEVGVPSSDGIGHYNIHGMNQGHLVEKDQGIINSKLFRSTVEEGLMGAAIFSWQDEWFKTSWNTVSDIDRDTNQNWFNSLCYEQSYGMLGFDPGRQTKIILDGSDDDWKRTENSGSTGSVPEIEIASDEGYIYIGVWSNPNDNTLIMIDTMPDHGTSTIPQIEEISDMGIEFLIEIDGPDNSRILVENSYDKFENRHGSTKNEKNFHPILMLLSEEQRDPLTGRSIPRQEFEIGALEWGTTDTTSKDFSSIADICSSADGSFIEIRVPWAMLNFRNPAAGEIIGADPESETSIIIKDIGFKVLKYKQENNNKRSVTAESDIFQHELGGWSQPSYHERLKDSYYIMQETFENTI